MQIIGKEDEYLKIKPPSRSLSLHQQAVRDGRAADGGGESAGSRAAASAAAATGADGERRADPGEADHEGDGSDGERDFDEHADDRSIARGRQSADDGSVSGRSVNNAAGAGRGRAAAEPGGAFHAI